MMSRTQSDPKDLVAEEEEASTTLEEESKETAEETEAETTENQTSVGEEVPTEKIKEKEAEEEEAEEEEEREEIEVVEERICTIPFRKVWATPMGKRTPRASRVLRAFVKRHMKAENVEISNEVNEELWARGIRKPPRQITVRLVKDKEGRVIVYPATTA